MKTLILFKILNIIFLNLFYCEPVNLNRTILEIWLSDGFMGASIDVSEKNITNVEKNTFNDLLNLTELTFSNNLIKNFEMGTFDTPTNLVSLEIDYNQLEILETNIFMNLKNLISLTLAGNRNK